MFSLVELFAADADFIAYREAWEKPRRVFGLARRTIENKDIESTLVFDERVRHFIEGKPLVLGASTKIWDGEVVRDYFPSHEDMFAGDWIVEDLTEQIRLKRDKLALD